MLYPMLYHEESPEKPQYNIAIPPFLDNPLPFSRINFRTPPTIPPILKNSNPPHLMTEDGGRKGVLELSSQVLTLIESSNPACRLDRFLQESEIFLRFKNFVVQIVVYSLKDHVNPKFSNYYYFL